MEQLEAIYTMAGQGTMIVVDEEAGVFFQQEGDTILYVVGKPEWNLDGGAFAEEPKVLTSAILREWFNEGLIPLPESYLRAVRGAFRRTGKSVKRRGLGQRGGVGS